jgi:HK97 family phage prohead protease
VTVVERKIFEAVHSKALDGKGEYESVVSVFGNVDSYGDRVLAGAFVDELANGFPPIVYSHRWELVPIGAAMDAREVFNFELDNGNKVDGLYIAGKLLVDDHETARAAYAAMTTKGGDGRAPLRQHSFAYGVGEARYVDEDGQQIRELVKISPLYEVGPTLVGANPETGLAKALEGAAVRDVRRLLGLNPDAGPDVGTTVVKGVIPFKDATAAPVDAAWDSAYERAQADVDDLRAMAAWVNSTKVDEKGAYLFLHHRADAGHPVVWRGVRSSMGALLAGRAEIPESDRKGVYAHLAAHFEAFEKAPPEFRHYADAELAELELDDAPTDGVDVEAALRMMAERPRHGVVRQAV